MTPISPASRRRRLAALLPIVLPTLFAIGAGALLVTGGGRQSGAEEASVGLSEMEHVHGLGVDPADGTLFIGSHLGLFRARQDGSSERVGRWWHDTMSFVVVGPGEFLASGHPDLRTTLPTHLGLIRSIDAGRTWDVVSRGGRADFHALDAAAGVVVGYDELTNRLLTSSDLKSWRTLDRRRVVDIAVAPRSVAPGSPADGPRVLATTPSGDLLAYPGTASEPARAVATAPPLAHVDWPRLGLVVGVAPGGEVQVSRDQGDTWSQVGALGGAPEALEVSDEGWYAASRGRVLLSTDEGATWSVIA